MKVLVACEFSGVVRKAFADRGHDAWSCDLEPTEIPGNHYQCDVRDVLSLGWDMMIAFPPCTYIAAVGAARWKEPGRLEKQKDAIDFFRLLYNQDILHIALENPVGALTRLFRRPDQYIEPYWFGEDKSKKTGLWLKNLPPLMASYINLDHSTFVNKIGGKDKSKIRSRTFVGVAQAMAEQWG